VDWHKHKCDACDFVWEHDGDDLDNREAEHRCPGCGREQFSRHYDDEPVTKPPMKIVHEMSDNCDW